MKAKAGASPEWRLPSLCGIEISAVLLLDGMVFLAGDNWSEGMNVRSMRELKAAEDQRLFYFLIGSTQKNSAPGKRKEVR